MIEKELQCLIVSTSRMPCAKTNMANVKKAKSIANLTRKYESNNHLTPTSNNSSDMDMSDEPDTNNRFAGSPNSSMRGAVSLHNLSHNQPHRSSNSSRSSGGTTLDVPVRNKRKVSKINVRLKSMIGLDGGGGGGSKGGSVAEEDEEERMRRKAEKKRKKEEKKEKKKNKKEKEKEKEVEAAKELAREEVFHAIKQQPVEDEEEITSETDEDEDFESHSDGNSTLRFLKAKLASCSLVSKQRELVLISCEAILISDMHVHVLSARLSKHSVYCTSSYFFSPQKLGHFFAI